MPSPDQPPPRSTLASLVQDWLRLDGAVAIVNHAGNRALPTTYAELAKLAGRFAAELDRRGIVAGERVVLWGANSPWWIAAFFGCVLRGVLVVPLDAAGTAAFADRVVAETRPRLVAGDAALLKSVRAESLGPDATLDFATLSTALPVEPLFTPDAAVVEDAPLQIVFTSGTTAEPKGVVHTHRNVLASLRPIEAGIARYRRLLRWVRPLRLLHTLPFSHVFGQFMGLWIPPALGAELHLIDSLDPARLLGTIRRERISVLVAVPRVLELLRVHLQGSFPKLERELAASGRLNAWQRWWRFRRVHAAFGFKFWAFVCGGATLPAELEGFFNALGFALIQGYGMTETAALVTLNHPFKIGRGTLGKALPGREIRLSPEGEILVRGDMLAAGAWHGGRFQPRAAEWLATGDLATQDPTGELRFTGRLGDTIVTAAGMNVHPVDLEAALLRQPGVRACAVVGCGPEPVAVLLFAGDEPALRQAVEHANRELAPFQQLRRVLRWPEPALPYTPTGKLLRRRIAAWACAQLGGGPAPEAIGDELLRLVEMITHEHLATVSDSSRLTEDLRLDSLARVQLQSALEERYGVPIDDAGMQTAATLGDLRALLGERSPSAPSGVASSMAPAAPGAGSRPSYPRWPWSTPVRWLRIAFLELVAKPLVRLLANPRVRREAVAPIAGPMLIIANHINTFDVPLVLYALRGPLRRRIAIAMSAELLADLRAGRKQGSGLRNLLARLAYWLLLALFNVFPLPRSSGFRESFAHAGAALDRGDSVLIFPEGHRSWSGELQPFRPGIGLLVQASRVPVLPVALQGMGAAARRGRRWFRPAGLAVHVGRPLVFSSEQAPEQITHELESALLDLRPS